MNSNFSHILVTITDYDVAEIFNRQDQIIERQHEIVSGQATLGQALTIGLGKVKGLLWSMLVHFLLNLPFYLVLSFFYGVALFW